MNTRTILALSVLLLPLMFGSVACDDSQMPAEDCVPGPGYGPAAGQADPGLSTAALNTTWVHGTYTCNPKVFTPDSTTTSSK